jgi:signal peptidase II
MSYAIPSLSRLPATDKGLVIADFLVPIRVGERTSPRLRNVALVLAGALLIYLTAQISIVIPGNPVPFTMQNFGVLVVGGALGNSIDRLRQGAVTDFLDFYWRDWHWPTFNVADICITLGAVLIFAASLPFRRRKEPVVDQS